MPRALRADAMLKLEPSQVGRAFARHGQKLARSPCCNVRRLARGKERITLARFSDAFLILKAEEVGLPLMLVPLVLVQMNAVYAMSA
jgi:hypothetical protein